MLTTRAGRTVCPIEPFVGVLIKRAKSRPGFLRQLLGLATGHEIDGFLKMHDIYDGITLEELKRQLGTLDRLSL